MPSLEERLGDRILELSDVELRKSRFSEREAFYVGKREFAHFHRQNEIDIRLTRKVIRNLKEELKADPKATLRGSSDWLEYRFPRSGDLDRAAELAALALEANR